MSVMIKKSTLYNIDCEHSSWSNNSTTLIFCIVLKFSGIDAVIYFGNWVPLDTKEISFQKAVDKTCNAPVCWRSKRRLLNCKNNTARLIPSQIHYFCCESSKKKTDSKVRLIIFVHKSRREKSNLSLDLGTLHPWSNIKPLAAASSSHTIHACAIAQARCWLNIHSARSVNLNKFMIYTLDYAA